VQIYEGCGRAVRPGRKFDLVQALAVVFAEVEVIFIREKIRAEEELGRELAVVIEVRCAEQPRIRNGGKKSVCMVKLAALHFGVQSREWLGPQEPDIERQRADGV
jgi:hypothetical protein